METSLMSSFGRKAAIVAVAFAAVGSTVFGGTALADDKKKDDGKVNVWNKGGDAKSGDAKGGECVFEGDLVGLGDFADLLTGDGNRTSVDQSCDTYTGDAYGGPASIGS
jgi:hypothetical protein